MNRARINDMLVVMSHPCCLVACCMAIPLRHIPCYRILAFSQKLEELQRHVAAMHASCDEAETQLRLTNEASAMLLERLRGHMS